VAGGAGLWLFHSGRLGVLVVIAPALTLVALRYVPMLALRPVPAACGLAELAAILHDRSLRSAAVCR
jgi:hypothetical protein